MAISGKTSITGSTWFSINLPPLRERLEDIQVLTQLFVDRFNKKLGCDIHDISPAAMTLLQKHHWPGNVRELENAIERGGGLV